MSSFKERVRSWASRISVYGGLGAVGRSLFPKRGALILYGHRLASDNEGYLEGLRPEWFDEQLAYLTRHYEIISLSELVRCFEERRPVPEKSVVLTFDDGFRDNLVNGLPILERYGVPATIFVATGCIAAGELPWSQRLGYLFQNTSRLSVELGGCGFDLSGGAGRWAGYQAAKEPLKRASREARERKLTSLARMLGVESPRDRMLSWTDLEYLKSRGIELGAHTYSHALLACIAPDEARWEMERSREDLRERLGIERPSFCFPGGSHNGELMAMVRALGFRSAFRPDCPYRVNRLGNTDAFGLGRVGFPEAPAVFLEAELDGPLNFARSLLARVTGTSAQGSR